MRFSQPAPDVHLAVSSLGPIRWLGTPFALGALLPLSGAVGLIDVQTESGDPASTWFLLLFATPFACIGLGLMFWQSQVVLDLRDGTVTQRCGAFFPVKSTTRKLKAYAAAVFEKRLIQGHKSSRTVYPVMLETPSGQTFDAIHCRDPRAARQTAEWLARVATLAVVDRTGDEDRRRPFEDLDVSLRQRRARGEAPRDPGPPPAKMRSALDARDGAITIELPRHGLQPLIILGLVFATGPLWAATLFLTMGASDDAPSGAFVAAAYAMAGLPTLGLWVTILYHALRRASVRATRDLLEVQEHGLRPRLMTMPTDEIEDLRVDESIGGSFDSYLGGGPPIRISSDRDTVEIGHALKQRESEYLAAVLHGVLSA